MTVDESNTLKTFIPTHPFKDKVIGPPTPTYA